MYWGDSPIVMAAEALKVFVHSLPSGSKFNICSFGSHYTYLFPDAIVKDYNQETMKLALQDIDTYPNESMGGTEIFKPMEHIFKNNSASGMRR